MPDFSTIGSGPKPRHRIPSGACDSHVHVYGPAYPVAPTSPLPPPTGATATVLKDLHRRLGVERALIVQPSAYGFDNAATLDGIRSYGPGARGIVVVPAGVADADLEALNGVGVRGIRFHMMPGGLLTWDELPRMATQAAAFDWTINLQLDGRTLPDHIDRLRALPCKLVIDHVGKFLEPVETDHPGFRLLLDLLDGGRCWVKLSAPYETSRTGPPSYDDVAVLGRALAAHAPQRMLWASNFPHPGAQANRPEDAGLMDAVLDWFDSDATRQLALVDNPAELYGF
jgi:D-galactarolactone isomerase